MIWFQIQFCIIFVHSTAVLVQPSCNYPKVIASLLSLQAIVFLFLFGAFYVRTYSRKPTTSNGTTQKDLANGKPRAITTTKTEKVQ